MSEGQHCTQSRRVPVPGSRLLVKPLYSRILLQMSFESENSFFTNFPNPSCNLPHVCFTLINPWCCLIFHIYIFDLILPLSLLHCTDALTADIDTATIATVVARRKGTLQIFFLFLQLKPSVEKERAQQTLSQGCLLSCFLVFMTKLT